jgi:hypothetical protein
MVFRPRASQICVVSEQCMRRLAAVRKDRGEYVVYGMWGHAETSAHVKAVDDTLEGRNSPAQRLASLLQLVAAEAPGPGDWFSQLWRSLRFPTLSACGTTLGDTNSQAWCARVGKWWSMGSVTI